MRNLRTRTFVTAGIATDAPAMPNRAAIPNGPPGIWSSSRTLRRGDTYKVSVYTPKPTERELRGRRLLLRPRLLGVPLDRPRRPRPPPRAGAPPGPVPLEVRFPEWDAAAPPEVIRPGAGADDPIERLDGDKALARLRPAPHLGALAGAAPRRDNPFEYVKSVEAYLGRGFTYTESPPASARTLEGFLFEAKSGYCQQYSGAMALLLRMARHPGARGDRLHVGLLDRKAKEYVVRDLDAHSWVEAWFPEFGWVTFDPTPSAAPPRSQGDERGSAAIGDAPGPRRRRRARPARRHGRARRARSGG